MSSEYRNNHYVPEWYQRRFIPEEQKVKNLFYRNLSPDVFVDSRGVKHIDNPIKKWGPSLCFVEKDLYTTRFGNQYITDIEKIFFGKIDREGRNAVEYYSNFAHPWDGGGHFQEMLMYMSTQRFRTPKGLEWIAKKARTNNRYALLKKMIEWRQFHCAIWAECVWSIADASHSQTKFIFSDNPVTIYNRACGPKWCERNGDPDIRNNASHTFFPLSPNKILILTNLSWVRNPYQSEMDWRPNPRPYRNAIFHIEDIQTLRSLSEEEVIHVNFITKSMAKQFIAGGQEEWLYPENKVHKTNWARFGSGYLLMPDPRSVTYGGQIIIGHKDGSSTSFDEYGRRPGEFGFRGFSKSGVESDWYTFQRFQGEFARLFGPRRRGRAAHVGQLENEVDDDDYHQYHLQLEKENRYKRK